MTAFLITIIGLFAIGLGAHIYTWDKEPSRPRLIAAMINVVIFVWAIFLLWGK